MLGGESGTWVGFIGLGIAFRLVFFVFFTAAVVFAFVVWVDFELVLI